MNKKAFTLAEVLITLTIIGVIAAITIPNLIAKYEKEQTVIKLKKAYSTISNAIKMSVSENGDTSTWPDISTEELAEQYFTKYFKNAKVETTTMSKIRNRLDGGGYYELSGQGNRKESWGVWRSDNTVKNIILPSGIQLFLLYNSPTYKNKNLVMFGIDLNGYKKPNRLGKDNFFVVLWKDTGKVDFYHSCDSDGEKYVTRSISVLKNGTGCANRYGCNNNDAQGWWCGALIQAQGWQITDDYPW